jgi:hypothetical protein
MIQNMSKPRSASIDTSLAEGGDGLNSWVEFSTAVGFEDVDMRPTLMVAPSDEQANAAVRPE